MTQSDLENWQKWLKHLVIHLREFIWLLWKHRNEIKHHHGNKYTAAEISHMSQTIARLYNTLHGTVPDQATLLEKPWAFKQEWILQATFVRTSQHDRLHQHRAHSITSSTLSHM